MPACADGFRYRVAHRLYKAIDQRRTQLHAAAELIRPRMNPFSRPRERRFPFSGSPHGRERLRHAAAHLLDGLFVAFGVLLEDTSTLTAGRKREILSLSSLFSTRTVE